MSAAVNIYSLISKSVLDFALFTSTLYAVTFITVFCRYTSYISRGPPENNVTSPELQTHSAVLNTHTNSTLASDLFRRKLQKQLIQ